MHRTLAFHALVLFCILVTGCAAPGSIEQASSLQLEAFANTQQSVDSYADLVDREIQSIQALRRTSMDLAAVVTAVETVAADPGVTAKPVEALDALSTQTAIERRKNAAQPDHLEDIRKQHRKNLAHLKSLLRLFQQNQELVNLYLRTDLGPSQEQITGLNEGLMSLKEAEAEDSP